MIAYIIRRLLYAIPILIGVNVITFGLFFMVNTPFMTGRDTRFILIRASKMDDRPAAGWISRSQANLPNEWQLPPFVLLPAINELRMAHDEVPLSEIALFQPDFSRVFAISAQTGVTPTAEHLKKLRRF